MNIKHIRGLLWIIKMDIKTWYKHNGSCLMDIPHSHLKYRELVSLPVSHKKYSNTYQRNYNMITWNDFKWYCIKRLKFIELFRCRNLFNRRFCKHNRI